MLKLKTLDSFIVLVMFFLLPVDMINGIILKKGIILPISIGQLFKLFLLLLIFTRLIIKPLKIFLSFVVFLVLLIPTIYQLFIQNEGVSILHDIIKISKYITPLICFLFFVEIIKNNDHQVNKRIFNLVKFSYLVLIGNILLKYIGLGYPMYEFGDIGSKGFFYAGNEISALFIILSSIIAYDLWVNNKRVKYFLFLLLNIFVGITITSKTGIIGNVLVFILIPIKGSFFKNNIKRIFVILTSLFVLLPTFIFYSLDYIKASVIFIRLNYFFNKFDFWTFILSNRNNFFDDALESYKDNYNFIEKIIGVGESRYNYLNNDVTVEIDFLDIFFAFGVVGVLLFVIYNFYLLIQSLKFKRTGINDYASFVFLMIIVLFFISGTAGHVYSSGMSAVFIGLLFSLMFLKANNLK